MSGLEILIPIIGTCVARWGAEYIRNYLKNQGVAASNLLASVQWSVTYKQGAYTYNFKGAGNNELFDRLGEEGVDILALMGVESSSAVSVDAALIAQISPVLTALQNGELSLSEVENIINHYVESLGTAASTEGATVSTSQQPSGATEGEVAVTTTPTGGGFPKATAADIKASAGKISSSAQGSKGAVAPA